MLKKYEDALNKPLPDISVTEETKKFISDNPHMHRGSVRVFTGRIYTDEEFEDFVEKALAKELP